MITRTLTNHTHHNSTYETSSDCGNCGENNCEHCRIVYGVNGKSFYDLAEAREYEEKLKFEERTQNSLTHKEIIDLILKSLGYAVEFKSSEIRFREFTNQDDDTVTVYSKINKYDKEIEDNIFESFYSTVYGIGNQCAIRSEKFNKRLKEMKLEGFMDIDIITVLSVLMCAHPILNKKINTLNLMSELTYWIDTAK